MAPNLLVFGNNLLLNIVQFCAYNTEEVMESAFDLLDHPWHSEDEKQPKKNRESERRSELFFVIYFDFVKNWRDYLKFENFN